MAADEPFHDDFYAALAALTLLGIEATAREIARDPSRAMPCADGHGEALSPEHVAALEAPLRARIAELERKLRAAKAGRRRSRRLSHEQR